VASERTPLLRDHDSALDQAIAEVAAILRDALVRSYLGFELCHPLPVIGGRLVGIEFADTNARLAARSLRETIAEVARQRHTGRGALRPLLIS